VVDTDWDKLSAQRDTHRKLLRREREGGRDERLRERARERNVEIDAQTKRGKIRRARVADCTVNTTGAVKE